ncbi:MAG: DUF6443 domain-containing protein [Candidatus Azobacteroides sp.]|nr:DUF6443 domain-containing protein [Candidatus Azobacteroides sp.]
MKKIQYIPSLMMLWIYPVFVYSQNPGDIMELSSTPSGGEIKACHSVILKPGFSFTATSGQSLLLTVDPGVCSAYVQKDISLSSSRNYIVRVTPLDETDRVNITGNGIETARNVRSEISIQYFDGLGRPVELVQAGVTPLLHDLVTCQEYDAFGRESKTYLPVPAAGNNGGYLSSFPQVSYYGDDNPYAETGYEPSPLNRITSQYGPGTAWRADGGHPVKTEYLTNTASGVQSCACYFVTSDGKLSKNGNYSPGQLYVTGTTDEDGNDTYEFKDKLGRVVLTRMTDKTQSGDNNRLHDTYYVYDDFGNKRFVLPPSASDALTADKTWGTDDYILGLYAYAYKYDDRMRCTEKKLPGCDPVYFVYDKADRLILTQDGNQRLKSEWSFNKYDAFGRVILSGIYASTTSHADLQTQFKSIVVKEEAGTGNYGYTWNTPPTVTPDKVLTVNYYDDYEFLLNRDPVFRQNLDYETKAGYGEKYVNAQYPSCPAKGLLVGTRVKMLDGSGREIVTAMYYDGKGRPVQTKSVNHLGGVDKEYVSYDFVGNPTERLLVHGRGNITEQYRYEYDHAGRLTKTWHKIDNQNEVLMSEQAYDDLGRLSSKKLHNGTETVNYAYNIRDWLKSINSPRFAESLYYQDAPSGTTARYNGNISAVTWKVDREPFYRTYKFSYDGLDLLTDSYYGEGSSPSAVTDNNLFDESFRYDKQGNVTFLYRNSVPVSGMRNQGAVSVNSLSYTYSGNRVQSIRDTGSGGLTLYGSQAFLDGDTRDAEYLYDKNGNMTTDYNKGIAKINYNVLNLPEVMQFKQGHGINYGYDASGTKRVVDTYTAKEGVTVPMGTTASVSVLYHSGLDYCGNAVYFGSGTGVSRLYTPEGYINRQYGVTGDWVYYYTLKDHLGSVRYEFKGDGTNVGYTHYYPSGIEFTDPGTNSQTLQSKERYNGKEFQSDFGLNMLDYWKRNLDASRFQFTTMDPLAEKYPWISPYAYCANNPVNAVDLRGDSITYAINSTITNPDGTTSFNSERYYYGQDANGNYGFIGADGQIYSGSNAYLNSLTTAVNDLRTGGNVGNSLVGELMNSTNTVQIVQGRNNIADPNGAFIKWNSNSINGSVNEIGSLSRPAYIGLGHEMAHIQDIWNGTFDNSTWAIVTDINGNSVNIPNSEKYATHIENQLRAENGISLRTHYTYGTINGKNIGDERTRIINGNVSLFYTQSNGSVKGILLLSTPFIYNRRR